MNEEYIAPSYCEFYGICEMYSLRKVKGDFQMAVTSLTEPVRRSLRVIIVGWDINECIYTGDLPTDHANLYL